jgi:5-methylcytosine-specific restriction endonuclease McrA
LFFDEMEVEHLLPRALVDADNATLFALHGLDAGVDLLALENLAPSCGPCNRGKGKRPPPRSPLIAMVLANARAKARGIRSTAAGRAAIARFNGPSPSY